MNIICGAWREHMILAIEFDCEVKVEAGQQVPIIKRIGLDLVGPLRISDVCVFVPSLYRFHVSAALMEHTTVPFALTDKTIAETQRHQMAANLLPIIKSIANESRSPNS